MGLGVINVYQYLSHAPVCFAHENMKKTPSKVGYFSKIKGISFSALTTQTAQNWKFMME